MSALSRIRNNMGLVATIIFIALLAFILTDFLAGVTGVFGGPPPAGTVAGAEISDQEFELRVANRNQQGANTQLQRSMLRNQVWNEMVNDRILNAEYEKIGLSISDEELIDMMAGNNIPQDVLDYFSRFYGANDITTIKQVLKYLNSDPRGKDELLRLEDYLLRSRGQEKYLNLVEASFLGSKAWARDLYKKQNRKVNISYLSVPYTTIPDSTVPVSDSELRDYISDHEDQFKQEEETHIRFVTFNIIASAADSVAIFKKLNNRKSTFSKEDNDSLFTAGRTRNTYSVNYLPISSPSIPAAIRDSVVDAEPKAAFGPIMEGGYYKVFKVVGTETGEVEYAKINHILITPDGNTNEDTTAARNKAADIRRQAVNGGDFSQLAADNSDDPSSKNRGGTIGWYSRNQFGEEFDEAIDAASVGSVIGPVKGRGGFHVVQIVAKTNKTFNMAEIEEEIDAGSETTRKIYREANTFAAKLKSVGNIDQAAGEMGYVAQESGPLSKISTSVPGLNGGRNLIVWGLHNDVQATSRALDVDRLKYVVGQVVRKVDEGLKSIDDPITRNQVLTQVRNQKKAEQIKSTLASTAGQDLNAMKTAAGAGATVSTATNIAFDAATIPGIGREPKIIGEALGMAEGETSAPIEGTTGVFVVNVTSITEAPEPDEATIKSLLVSQRLQGRGTLSSRVIPALTELADVEDNRDELEYLRQGQR